MSNTIKKITAFTAAVMLSIAPGTALAGNTAGSTPSTTPESIQTGHEQPSHPHHGRGFRAGGYFILNESAKLLEMDRAELVSSLKSGKTLYDLAKEKKGWTEEQYIQKLSDAASHRLEASLKNGQLTADELQKLKAGLPAMLKLSIANAANVHSGKSTEQLHKKTP